MIKGILMQMFRLVYYLVRGNKKGITDLDGLTPIFYTQNEENVKCRLHIDHEEDWEWETQE